MNDIRRERTRKLYIDTACDIIRNQGMSAVTIRSISERVGYNSATLYSYFDNITDLFLCAELQFENELCNLFKKESEDKEYTRYVDFWAHTYAIMVKFYMENPNVFDCSFVGNIPDNRIEEVLEQRNQNSGLVQFVKDALMRVAYETGKSMESIMHISETCMAQVIGTVLMHTKGRFVKKNQIDINEFENTIRRVIKDLMEKSE